MICLMMKPRGLLFVASNMFLVIKIVIKDIEYVNRSHKIGSGKSDGVRGKCFAGCYWLTVRETQAQIICFGLYTLSIYMYISAMSMK